MPTNDLLGRITDKKRLMSLLESIEDGQARRIDEEEFRRALSDRVRGQDHVINDLARVVRLQWGKQRRGKPIANLLFLGPTGTGKTELAKAMAEYLFGDSRAMLRFDCAEFGGPESKHQLIGTPNGYVGAQAGGKLTRPMLNNPRRLVLFDEVEKAWSGVFDLFLSMMGEGHLTEQGSGKVADFTQSVIVLTSNAEHEAIRRIREQIDDLDERTDSIKKHLCDCQVFRPEVVGRFDKVYVFEPLSGTIIAEIAALKMVNLAREYGLELEYVDPELIAEAMSRSKKLSAFGVRELERVIGDQLGEALLLARESGASVVRLRIDADGGLSVAPSTLEARPRSAADLEKRRGKG